MTYDAVKITSVDLLNQDRVVNDEMLSNMFIDFIHNYRGEVDSYYTQLHTNLTQGIYTLVIQMDHINSYSPELYTHLSRDPLTCVDLFEKAILKEHSEIQKFQVQILSAGTNIKIREIGSVKANKIVKIEGIIISASSIFTKPKEIHIECRGCNEVKRVTENIPRRCGNTGANECPLDPYVVVPEKCTVDDIQYVKIQEAFEDIPMGETPRHFTVMMSNTLVNQVTPGSRVRITGVYVIRNKVNRSVTYLSALGIEHEKTKVRQAFTEAEEGAFRALVASGEIYKKISESIAPGIFGHENVKQAIACMLFGGTRKEQEDRIGLRGDINVLLLGDPGIAKSQFLKFVEQCAPISVYTSGKGSSAAGLTASVLRDRNNDFYLEGGALVLADGGVCCIDEFDKMNEQDRVAIHEAMEQQTISIAKAGITTVLNTRTAILAAANPVFGRYDDYKTPAENIEFGSTILSRFDLIFILKDTHSERDKETAKHVMNLHLREGKRQKTKETISLDVLRNFIQYAKSKCHPVLGEEAANKLNRFYISIRQQVDEYEKDSHKKSSVPITVRQLEAIIRVSESLARMELSAVVLPGHVDEAIRLFQLSTMNAVSQGHQIEGMTRTSYMSTLLLVIEKIKELLPIGSSKRMSEIVKSIEVEEKIVKKAIDYMLKRNKLIAKEHGKVLVRTP